MREGEVGAGVTESVEDLAAYREQPHIQGREKGAPERRHSSGKHGVTPERGSLDSKAKV